MKTADPILSLVAAMERAKSTCLTDGDSALNARRIKLLDDVHSLCDAAHAESYDENLAGEKLRTEEITWVLAQIAGWYIGAFSNGKTPGERSVSELLSAGQFAHQMLESIKLTKLARRD